MSDAAASALASIFGCGWSQQVVSNYTNVLPGNYRPSPIPTVTIPAGISWQRTGGSAHRVTIRRKPEVVPDYSMLMNSASAPNSMAMAGNTWPRRDMALQNAHSRWDPPNE